MSARQQVGVVGVIWNTTFQFLVSTDKEKKGYKLVSLLQNIVINLHMQA